MKICSRSPRGNVDWNWKPVTSGRRHWVVPHAGTWIEILIRWQRKPLSIVVPHAGTWIEIIVNFPGISLLFCRSPRGNVDWNLKMIWYLCYISVVPHAGTWIEISLPSVPEWLSFVVPHAGTWIEIICREYNVNEEWRRSPRGNVDWNRWCHVDRCSCWLSFPTRERGLKLQYPCSGCKWLERRSPRGNVDWNCFTALVSRDRFVVPHAGTWIEIHTCYFHFPLRRCRSPRGNVDWNYQMQEF